MGISPSGRKDLAKDSHAPSKHDVEFWLWQLCSVHYGAVLGRRQAVSRLIPWGAWPRALLPLVADRCSGAGAQFVAQARSRGCYSVDERISSTWVSWTMTMLLNTSDVRDVSSSSSHAPSRRSAHPHVRLVSHP